MKSEQLPFFDPNLRPLQSPQPTPIHKQQPYAKSSHSKEPTFESYLNPKPKVESKDPNPKQAADRPESKGGQRHFPKTQSQDRQNNNRNSELAKNRGSTRATPGANPKDPKQNLPVNTKGTEPIKVTTSTDNPAVTTNNEATTLLSQSSLIKDNSLEAGSLANSLGFTNDINSLGSEKSHQEAGLSLYPQVSNSSNGVVSPLVLIDEKQESAEQSTNILHLNLSKFELTTHNDSKNGLNETEEDLSEIYPNGVETSPDGSDILKYYSMNQFNQARAEFAPQLNAQAALPDQDIFKNSPKTEQPDIGQYDLSILTSPGVTPSRVEASPIPQELWTRLEDWGDTEVIFRSRELNSPSFLKELNSESDIEFPDIPLIPTRITPETNIEELKSDPERIHLEDQLSLKNAPDAKPGEFLTLKDGQQSSGTLLLGDQTNPRTQEANNFIKNPNSQLRLNEPVNSAERNLEDESLSNAVESGNLTTKEVFNRQLESSEPTSSSIKRPLESSTEPDFKAIKPDREIPSFNQGTEHGFSQNQQSQDRDSERSRDYIPSSGDTVNRLNIKGDQSEASKLDNSRITPEAFTEKIRQIETEVLRMQKSKIHEADISINLGDLGRVTMKLELNEREVRLNITQGCSEAAGLILSQLGQLKESLSNHNLNLNQDNQQNQDDSQNKNQQREFNQQQQQNERNNSRREFLTEEA